MFIDHSPPANLSGGFADSRHYDLGGYENFKQVFGDEPHLWALPIFSSKGNGVEFDTRAYTNTRTDVPARTPSVP
jgi:hypothetical protein